MRLKNEPSSGIRVKGIRDSGAQQYVCAFSRKKEKGKTKATTHTHVVFVLPVVNTGRGGIALLDTAEARENIGV